MTAELKGIHAKTFQDLDVIKDVLKLDEEKIAELEKENEEMKKGLGCETCQIHLEYMRLNDKIRELEQKLEQTEKDLADYQFNYPTIKELSKENKELKKKCYKKAVKDYCKLEQENNKLLDVINNQDVKIADLEKENAELDMKRKVERQIFQGIVEKKNEQLTKAKELLNEFMRISKASDEDFEHDYSELIGETEQFIKDLEK